MTTKTDNAQTTDRIERRIELRAPRARVWRAIANASEFGAWFGVKFDGDFAGGATMRGRITFRGVEHTLEIHVERIEPERYFAYRWHPSAIDPKVDYSVEPTTLVEFRLDEDGEGTILTIAESGFDSLPAARRDEAFRGNDRGWTNQAKNIERHVSQA